ncbi:hypothetical protein PMIN06_004030 [Paraphaeosphaeria minitans]
MAKAPNELLITTATVTPTLILGIPVIIGAIVLENTYVPGIVLGLKSIDAGSSGPKTLTFHLQTNLDDTVRASTIYILTRTKSSSLPLYHPSAHESARTYRGVRRVSFRGSEFACLSWVCGWLWCPADEGKGEVCRSRGYLF